MEGFDHLWWPLLGGELAGSAPVLLVATVGAVMSVVFWARSPRVGLLILLGFTGLIVWAVPGSFIGAWYPIYLGQLMVQGALSEAEVGVRWN